MDHLFPVIDPVCHGYWAQGQIEPVLADDNLLGLVRELVDRNPESEHLMISLSGGVDSMVLASLLVQMGKPVVAVHIDYANREESGLEAEFVQWWCQQNGIICHIRRIDEVTRGETPRTEYEETSRTIRYDTYKEVMQTYPSLGVFVGHHSGDVAENVFTNFMHGRSLLDLPNMPIQSVNHGVQLFRPLLSVNKSVIEEFAQQYHVPYFKDTTPDWSNRGILRRQTLPHLQNQYGGVQKQLLKAAQESDEWRAVIMECVMEPLLQSIVRTDLGMMIDLRGYLGRGLSFWMLFFQQLLHPMGYSLPSQKSIGNLIGHLKRLSRCSVRLKRDLNCCVDQGVLIISQMGRFDGGELVMGENVVGKWKVLVSDGNGEERKTYHKGRSIKAAPVGRLALCSSYNALLNNRVQYLVPVCEGEMVLKRSPYFVMDVPHVGFGSKRRVGGKLLVQLEYLG